MRGRESVVAFTGEKLIWENGGGGRGGGRG